MFRRDSAPRHDPTREQQVKLAHATAMRPAIASTLLIALALAQPIGAAAATVQWRGLLDLVAAERTTAYGLNVLTPGDNPFTAYRIRLFAGAEVSPRVSIASQFVLSDAVMPYVDGAYAILTPFPSRDLHLELGKLPWAVGTYAPRTYSNENPLIGTPLMYSHHTSLVWYEIIPTADALLRAAGTGSYGVNYFGYSESKGMPLVDDAFWDVGATLLGAARPLEYAIGMSAGTPGWGSTTQDENSGKTVLGRIGLAPLPSLRFGVSGAYGPYVVSKLDPKLPAGHDANDYHQKLAMGDLEISAGHVEFHAEGARNFWETPRLGELEVTSGYGELKVSFLSGLFVAGRWDFERFGEIMNSAGVRKPWDRNTERIEGGLGYRFSREVRAKLVYQRTTLQDAKANGIDDVLSMLAAQLSIGF